MALVADLLHKERGERMGWFSTSTLLGRFIAPIAGGGIIGLLIFNPGLSHKVVYLVCGAAGLIALALAVKLPEPKKNKRNPTWEETFGTFKAVISTKGIISAAAVEAAILFAYGTFETFLPLYSMELGLSAYAVGIFLSSQVITLALTKPVMGRFSDRHGRKPQIAAGAALGALCIGGFSFFRSFIPLLALSIAFGLCLSIVTSATSAFIADLSRKEAHGSAMGILGSIMDIGHTAGPLVSGMTASFFGLGKAFAVAALVLALAASLFWIEAGRPRPALK